MSNHGKPEEHDRTPYAVEPREHNYAEFCGRTCAFKSAMKHGVNIEHGESPEPHITEGLPETMAVYPEPNKAGGKRRPVFLGPSQDTFDSTCANCGKKLA